MSNIFKAGAAKEDTTPVIGTLLYGYNPHQESKNDNTVLMLTAEIGDAGAYSLKHYKVITAGEGGALVTKSRQIYERALIYHDSSAVAFFGTQLDGISETLFGGTDS